MIPAGEANPRPARDREETPPAFLPWVIRLRWVSFVALVLAVGAAAVFWRVRLPLAELTALLAALAATNIALARKLRGFTWRRGVVGAVLLVDVALLTAVLGLVGGPVNPFSVAYLVEVTLAAVALGHGWALAICAASAAGYGLVFFVYRPLEFTVPSMNYRILGMHLSGMWFAFAAAALLIAHFVSRAAEAIAARERALDKARLAAARNEQLASLFALGAGAAHELATPLGTIATAAGELERALEDAGFGEQGEWSDAAQLIRSEVDRCCRILDQLSGRAVATGTEEQRIDLVDLSRDLRYRLGAARGERLDVEHSGGADTFRAPVEPLRQALVALLANAFDASTTDQRVLLRSSLGEQARFEVTDSGRGISSDEQARVGEPFYTTKPRGAGLGLGLFLVRTFAEQMGGELEIASKPGAGTTATLRFPAR